MTLTLPSATARLYRELNDAELSADKSIADVATLVNSAARARMDVKGIGRAVGHKALLRLHKTLGSAIALRGELLRAHNELIEVGTEVGVVDHGDCPDKQMGNLADASSIKQTA